MKKIIFFFLVCCISPAHLEAGYAGKTEEISGSQWRLCVRDIFLLEGGDIAECVGFGTAAETSALQRCDSRTKRVFPGWGLLALADGDRDREKETGVRVINTGALSFKARWRDAPAACSSSGIKAVEAAAYGPANTKLASVRTRNCSGFGMLKDVPAGPNIRLVVTGVDSSGNVLYRGERRKLAVAAGRTTAVGTITAAPFSPVPATPANAAMLADGRVGFTWTRRTGAAAYRIQVSPGPAFTRTIIDSTRKAASYKIRAALSSQTYYWRVRATDTLGNRSAWSLPGSFTVDSEAPANTTAGKFINHGTAATNSATVSLAISAEKKNGIVAAYYLSENPRKPAAGDPGWVTIAAAMSYAADVPYTLSGGDGGKRVYVAFRDAIGNVSEVASDSIVLDTAPPHTSITRKPDDPTNSTSASFGFASTKTDSTFSCSLDGSVYSACTGTEHYDGLPAGRHTFNVKATDAVGNADPVSAVYSWTIEAGAVITNQPPDPSYSASAGFNFTARKGGATFQCKLDKEDYSACASPASYIGLLRGAHTFSVKAINASENKDAAPASYTWVVKALPVNTTPPGFINSYFTGRQSIKISISATSEEGITGYYISESPAAPQASDPVWVEVSATKTFSRSVPVTLSNGTGVKTLHVWFKDAEGKVSDAKSDAIRLLNSDHVAIILILLQAAAAFVSLM